MFRNEHPTTDSQSALLQQWPLIQGIADAAPDMLYVIDLTQMKIVYANQKVLTLFGKSLKELGKLGPQLFDLVVYPDDRPAFDQHIAELLLANNGEVKELTFRLLDADGRSRWVRTRRTIYKRDGDGLPTHAISVSQDVSKEIELQEIRHQLEEEKRKLEAEKQAEIFRIILSTQEEERRRISESLHNGLGQLLYGIKLNLCGLDVSMAIKDQEAYAKTHQYACDLLEEGIKEARRISHELMPRALQDFGIKAAIEDTCHKMEPNISFSYRFEGLDLLEKPMAIAAFRTIQELILNVGKHSKAQNAMISLLVSPLWVHITVIDNGIGFCKNQYSDGIGLKSLKHKVRLLKGELSIESSPENGTKVSIKIPQPPPSI